MSVSNFMIHPNSGSPKVWVKLDDGSCLFGSLVNGGIKSNAHGGDPDEKRRKGYVPISCNLDKRSLFTLSKTDVLSVINIAQRRGSVGLDPYSSLASLITSIVIQFGGVGFNGGVGKAIILGATGLPKAMMDIEKLRKSSDAPTPAEKISLGNLAISSGKYSF